MRKRIYGLGAQDKGYVFMWYFGKLRELATANLSSCCGEQTASGLQLQEHRFFSKLVLTSISRSVSRLDEAT